MPTPCAPITLVGPGAGGEATASAVVADIADVAARYAGLPFGLPIARLGAGKKAPMQRHEGGYYVRLWRVDHPGAAAAIAPRMAKRHLARKHRAAPSGDGRRRAIMPDRSSEPVPVVLITYATTEDAIRRRSRLGPTATSRERRKSSASRRTDKSAAHWAVRAEPKWNRRPASDCSSPA